MPPVLIFRHIAHEGPGYFGDFLDQQQIPYEIICIDANDSVPDRLDGIPALVFMGGAMSVNDPLPWIGKEIHLIQMAVEKGVPVLGHCLGGQLIAKALGAEVKPNLVTEIGWHKAEKLDNPAAEDWLDGLADSLELFHWHSETFSTPAGATRILKSSFCDNQAFIYGNCLAMQCHIEMTAPMVMQWVAEAGDTLSSSASVQSTDEILRDLRQRVSSLNRIADRIYTRWQQGLRIL